MYEDHTKALCTYYYVLILILMARLKKHCDAQLFNKLFYYEWRHWRRVCVCGGLGGGGMFSILDQLNHNHSIYFQHERMAYDLDFPKKYTTQEVIIYLWGYRWPCFFLRMFFSNIYFFHIKKLLPSYVMSISMSDNPSVCLVFRLFGRSSVYFCTVT